MSTPFDDWSREEKVKYAEERMNQMKKLNEKLMKRHQEVNQDRIDFERENPPMKAREKKEDKDRGPKNLEKRSVREWDERKTSWDWNLDQQDFHYPRSSKRSSREGYEERRNHKQNNWKTADVEKRETSFGYNKKFNSRFRRNQDSNSYFYSQNENQRAGKQNSYKNVNTANRCFKNWNNDSKKQHFTPTVDNDKVWRNDELNEAQNKQSRVETWIQSVNTECWSDNDEYSNSKTKIDGDDRTFRKSCYKNVYRKQTQGHRSSTSDSSYKEDGTQPRYDRLQIDRRIDQTKESDLRNFNREKPKQQFMYRSSKEFRNKINTSTNQRDVNHKLWNNHERENKKYQNYKASENWHNKNDYVAKKAWGGIVSDKEKSATVKTAGKGGTWSDQEDLVPDKQKGATVKTSGKGGAWSDQEDDLVSVKQRGVTVKTSGKGGAWCDQEDDLVSVKQRGVTVKTSGKGGAWSDQEDDLVGVNVSQYIASGWNQQNSDSDNWENLPETADKRYKENQKTEQTSFRDWSDKNSASKPARNINKSSNKQSKTNSTQAYKKKEIEVINPCFDNDTECVSENKRNNLESEVQNSNVQVNDVQMYEKEKYVNEVMITADISTGQEECIYNKHKSPERTNNQDDEGPNSELRNRPGQKSNDRETLLSLEPTKENSFFLENLVDSPTVNDSIEIMKCEVRGSEGDSVLLMPGGNNCKVFPDSCKSESIFEVPDFSSNEIELSPEVILDTSHIDKDLTIEAVPTLEEFLKAIQCRQSEYSNGSSNKTLNNTDKKYKKVQHVNSVVQVDNEIISSDSYFKLSANVENQPKETGNSSKEIELETNHSAFDDQDNDWSTITDENESESDEGDKVNITNINNN